MKLLYVFVIAIAMLIAGFILGKNHSKPEPLKGLQLSKGDSIEMTIMVYRDKKYLNDTVIYEIYP